MKLNDIVDLDTYPINQPGNQKYKDIINYNKKLLDNNGCCVLKNFIKEESINRMKQSTYAAVGAMLAREDGKESYDDCLECHCVQVIYMRSTHEQRCVKHSDADTASLGTRTQRGKTHKAG